MASRRAVRQVNGGADYRVERSSVRRFAASGCAFFQSSKPLHEAIVKKLRMMDIAGATVYRGLMGYGAQQRLHKSGWLGLSKDLPIMVSIVDTEEKIRKILPVCDEMVDEGLVVLSDVEIIKYTHSHPPEDETANEHDGSSRP